VGVPAVIRSGQEAAGRLLLHNGVHDRRPA
jgi:hypothetical protein